MQIHSPVSSNRFEALTGIRAIAAMMVFGYHFRKFWREDIPLWLLKPLNEFHTGVTLFFVLSGFLIAYTYADKPLRSGKDYCRYLLVRLARIFPVYLLLLTAKYIQEGWPTSLEAMLNYSLLKGFSDKLNLTGIPQSWSLTVELTFYLLAPLIFALAKKNLFRCIVFLFLLLLLSGSAGYGWHAAGVNKYSFLYDGFFLLNSTFMGRFPEFLSGVALALWLKQNKTPPLFLRRANTLYGGLFSMVCIVLISLFEKNIYAHGTDHPVGLLARNVLLPLFMAQLLYGLIIEKTVFAKILSSRLFVLLGNASYIFYLLHISYGYRVLEKIHVFPDKNFVFLWVISIAAYLLIEKPMYERIRQWVRKG